MKLMLNMALSLPYIGSKARIAELIIPMMPACNSYVELFAGALNVHFARCAAGIKARHTVLNDIDGEIMNFFEMCKLHLSDVIHVWDFSPIADSIFADAKARCKTPLLDTATHAERVQRAADWLYLRAFSMYGKADTLSTDIKQGNRHELIRQKILQVASLLSDCVILCRPALDAIADMRVKDKKNGYAGVFVYCDPPFIGGIQSYNAPAWKAGDLQMLIQALNEKKGIQYAISEYDSPIVRDIAEHFGLYLHIVTTTNNMGKLKAKTEVLLTNYILP